MPDKSQNRRSVTSKPNQETRSESDNQSKEFPSRNNFNNHSLTQASNSREEAIDVLNFVSFKL